MRIKIQGGTAMNGDPPLCHTCRHATVIRGARLRDEIIECGLLSSRHNRVTFPVTFCTDYVNRNHPSLREMEEIGWVLRTDAKKHHVGFVRSERLPWKERFVLDED
jgi:hypothetical protein